MTNWDSSNVPNAQKSSARIRAGENMSRTVKNYYILRDCVELLMKKDIHKDIHSDDNG